MELFLGNTKDKPKNHEQPALPSRRAERKATPARCSLYVSRESRRADDASWAQSLFQPPPPPAEPASSPPPGQAEARRDTGPAPRRVLRSSARRAEHRRGPGHGTGGSACALLAPRPGTAPGGPPHARTHHAALGAPAACPAPRGPARPPLQRRLSRRSGPGPAPRPPRRRSRSKSRESRPVSALRRSGACALTAPSGARARPAHAQHRADVPSPSPGLPPRERRGSGWSGRGQQRQHPSSTARAEYLKGGYSQMGVGQLAIGQKGKVKAAPGRLWLYIRKNFPPTWLLTTATGWPGGAGGTVPAGV